MRQSHVDRSRLPGFRLVQLEREQIGGHLRYLRACTQGSLAATSTLVVSAADPAAVEARLRQRLGESLCVVPSRWTKVQLDDVASQLHQRRQQWKIYQLGRQHADDGQARIGARLVRVLPQIAAWASSLPPGIVAFRPWHAS